MSFHLLRPLLVPILLFFSLGVFVRNESDAASAPLVSPTMALNAEVNGEIRVLIRFAVPTTSITMVESDLQMRERRAWIGFGRQSVRASLIGAAGAIVREYDDLPFMALKAGPAELRVLESLTGVVVEVIEDKLNAPFLAESAPLVQADQAWSGAFGGISLEGTGTVVAILDTGVDKNHLFLAASVIEEACFSAIGDCPGGQTSSGNPDSGRPCSVFGCDHGTHVAGIAAGNGQNGAVAPFSGVAPGASIMAVQVFSEFFDPLCGNFGLPSPCALAFDSDILAGLQHVYDLRTTYNFAAVNLSLGGAPSSTSCDGDFRKAAIDLLRAANIATVAAAGNDGAANGIGAPACISSAVSVGSTGDGSLGATQDVVSSFSNNASFLSLLAPGQWIQSSIPGGAFSDFQGTSMATPHVSGAFAILKQATPTATVDEMLAALQSSGLPVTDQRNNITKPRIRILDALNQLLPVPNLGEIMFSAASYSVGENQAKAAITVTRSGALENPATVDYATSNGTASAGMDYASTSGTLTFNPSETSKTFTVPIINDTLDEGDETINLVLSNPTGGFTLGITSLAVVTISDNDTAGSLRFSRASYTGREKGPVAIVTVLRFGGAASDVTVDFTTQDGSATAGADYAATSGTLTFGAGQTRQTITIPILSDTIDAANKTVDLILSNPTGGAILGVPSTAVLTITDDDKAGIIQFGSAAYTINENDGLATITIKRSRGTASGVTVDYAAGGGTAVAGVAYTATFGSVNFEASETAKTFTIPITDNISADGNRTVHLTLSNPTGLATLGKLRTATLTIVDDEVSLHFSQPSYSAQERRRSAKVTVTRSGPTASAVSVDFATSGGTATGGADYTATSGTLNFRPGVKSQTFTIPIINDTIDEPDETVNLTLSNPTGGASLGALSAAALTIIDND